MKMAGWLWIRSGMSTIRLVSAVWREPPLGDWITQLKSQSSPTAKIAFMPATEANFDYARAINWDKSPALRELELSCSAFRLTPRRSCGRAFWKIRSWLSGWGCWPEPASP